MKTTSIEKLSEVYNYLNGENRMSGEKAAELIKEVLRAESVAKRGKFDLYNYVSTDVLRPVLQGVYHEDGYKVATDAHILVAIRSGYPAEYEGKILKKDGVFCDGKYVDYKSVIPDGKGFFPREVDAAKFYSNYEEWKSEIKAKTGKPAKIKRYCGFCNCAVKIGNSYFSADYVEKLLSAMEAIGTTTLFLSGEIDRSAYAKTDSGTVLIIPLYDDGKFETVIDIN